MEEKSSSMDGSADNPQLPDAENRDADLQSVLDKCSVLLKTDENFRELIRSMMLQSIGEKSQTNSGDVVAASHPSNFETVGSSSLAANREREVAACHSPTVETEKLFSLPSNTQSAAAQSLPPNLTTEESCPNFPELLPAAPEEEEKESVNTVRDDLESPELPENDKCIYEYHMDHPKRGQAVIFSHQYSKDIPVNMFRKQVNTQLHFFDDLGFDVKIHLDKTKADILSILSSVAQEDHSDADCLVVVILTFSRKHHLLSNDLPYNVNELLTVFAGDKCKTLYGKPKIFLIGTAEVFDFPEDIGHSVSHHSKFGPHVAPIHADFLIANCAIEAHQCKKPKQTDSVFISALKDIFSEEMAHEDLVHSLVQVCNKINEELKDHENEKCCFRVQSAPRIISTLTRKVSFPPKARERNKQRPGIEDDSGNTLTREYAITELPRSQSTSTHKWDKEYFMKHPSRGCAIIFNNRTFEEVPELSRSDIDVKSLRTALEKMLFKVAVYDKMKQSEIKRILQKISQKDHSREDCLIVAVLTHGKESGVYFEEDLWSPFTDDKCQSLAGKPKIFFIQTCRREELGPDVVLPRKESDFVSPHGNIMDSIFLTVHDVWEGLVSRTYSDTRTSPIQSLCRAMSSDTGSNEFLKLLTQVNLETVDFKQMLVFNSTLRKKLFFSTKHYGASSSIFEEMLSMRKPMVLKTTSVEHGDKLSAKHAYLHLHKIPKLLTSCVRFPRKKTSHSKKSSHKPLHPTRLCPSVCEYDMNHKRRGKAAIFSHCSFGKHCCRQKYGVGKDKISLKKTFKRLGFEAVVHDFTKAYEIEAILQALAMSDHSDADCLVVVVLTHESGVDHMFANEHPYLMNHLLAPFKSSECQLDGKPKLFFIQACRGCRHDSCFEEKYGITFSEPVGPDFLIVFNNEQGFPSRRFPRTGTTFIQTLAEEIKNQDLHLERILTRVTHRLAVQFESCNIDEHRMQQLPVVYSTLRGTVFFRRKT